MKIPLLLDAKRMAIHDGPGMRTSFFELEYFDYARSKYQALGFPDTMPAKRLSMSSSN